MMDEGDSKPLSETEKRARRLVLLALMSSLMLAAMDTTIVSTAIPQIVADLGGFRLFSWVFSIYLIAQTVTIPVYGKLSDIYGRKVVLLFGMTLFLAGSLACAASPGMLSLIVFRGIQGLGAGAINATVATLAGDLYSVRERAAIQGWLSSVWGVAAITGPLLGGSFADYVSWRWIFLVNLPIGLLAATLIVRFLHESFEVRPHKIDYLGSFAVLASVSVFIFALLQGGQAWPWRSWQSAAAFAASGGLFVGTILIERAASEPVLPGWLWHERTLIGANLATLGLGIAMMAPSAYLPTFLQSVHRLDATSAGLVLATMSLGWPTASALSGKLYLHIGFRSTALIGACVAFLAASVFWFAPQPMPVWQIVGQQVLLGAGFGLVSTPLLVGSQSIVAWEQRGVVTGANMFSRYLGEGLGAAFYGAIFNHTLAEQLRLAPGSLHDALPASVNDVVGALHTPGLSESVSGYLRGAIGVSTLHLYAGMMGVTFLMIVSVVWIPKAFALCAKPSDG